MHGLVAAIEIVLSLWSRQFNLATTVNYSVKCFACSHSLTCTATSRTCCPTRTPGTGRPALRGSSASWRRFPSGTPAYWEKPSIFFSSKSIPGRDKKQELIIAYGTQGTIHDCTISIWRILRALLLCVTIDIRYTDLVHAYHKIIPLGLCVWYLRRFLVNQNWEIHTQRERERRQIQRPGAEVETKLDR